MGTDIMDNPGDAKYGMTKEQLIEAFKRLEGKVRCEAFWYSFVFWQVIP